MPRTCSHELVDASLVEGSKPVSPFSPQLRDTSYCESCQQRSFHPISITLYFAMSSTQIPVPVPRSSILVGSSFGVIGALCSLSPRAFKNKACPISRWNVSSCSRRLLGKSLRSDDLARAHCIARVQVLVSAVVLIFTSILMVGWRA